jgi:hypothetical protein
MPKPKRVSRRKPGKPAVPVVTSVLAAAGKRRATTKPALPSNETMQKKGAEVVGNSESPDVRAANRSSQFLVKPEE